MSNEGKPDETGLNLQNLNITESSLDDLETLRKKNKDMQTLLVRVITLLKEKTAMCLTLEKQNTALNIQINSLKDVVAITKDLLAIRNMEVENMHSAMASLQEKIKAERERQNEMLKTVNTANRINDDIKTEYQSQVNIFQELKEKYNEKVDLLTRENKKLQEEILELNGTLETDQNKITNTELVE